MENENIEPLRKIIHVDMDTFYASVEQRDNPELRGKPVAVGGMERGVVGGLLRSAQVRHPFSHALGDGAAQMPGLIFIKARFDAYKAVSKQIREIFEDYTDLVEPLSLDEAYLDVTHNHKAIASATLIAGNPCAHQAQDRSDSFGRRVL